MDRLPRELLLCIADFLKPPQSLSWERIGRGLNRVDDLLNLIKTCRGFHNVLLGFYYRFLIQQNGLETCLQLAVRKNSAMPMELIIDIAGDKFSWSDHKMRTWLETGIKFGGYEPFNWLLTEQKKMQMNVIKAKKSELLYAALWSKNERVLLRLFDEADQEDIHTREQITGNTLLISAVRRHQPKATIRYLLQRGISMWQRALGQTALDVAIEVNYLDAIEVFIEYDGQILKQYLWKGLGYISALRNMFPIAPFKLTSNPGVGSDEDKFRLAVMLFDNAPDEVLANNRSLKTIWGRRALMRAIECYRWGVAQRLIQHGIGIDFAASDNCSLVTTVIRCVEYRDPNEDDGATTIKMLLDKGVHIDFGFIDGTTWLHKARSAQIVEALIDHGFDVNVESAIGNTPLHLAVLRNEIDIVRVLVSRGANINCCNNASRETPLLQAVYRQSPFCISFLLEHGARVDITDEKGRTPLTVALKKNDTYTVDLLSRYS